MNSIRNLYARYKVIFDNILFVSLIQLFGLLAPLITYPYLVGDGIIRISDNGADFGWVYGIGN